MSTDKLRVGIIGMGFFAALSHVPHLRDTRRAKVVAISRRNAERLALAKEALTIPEAYTENHVARKGDLSADRQAALPKVLIQPR